VDGPRTAADKRAPTTDSVGCESCCQKAEDCVWGEIDHEILSRTDCICLMGCPGLIQNRQTHDRRQLQYKTTCDPRFDGQGKPCPIDDCIMPPPLSCSQGTCIAARDAGI
jgi:hypothetical protein